MLDILGEEDRAMMILKHAEGHSYDDLAEMFDMSVSACKMRLSRAKEKLKRRFPDHMEDHGNRPV
ncbi:MAG: sigma-70 region 4 domain-containing protein, partial [Planctomycetales bacterium]